MFINSGYEGSKEISTFHVLSDVHVHENRRKACDERIFKYMNPFQPRHASYVIKKCVLMGEILAKILRR